MSPVPRHFGDAEREYRALVGDAAVLDLGFRTIVRAHGEDRVSFLQGMLTNDVAALGVGAGCPALLLTIQGRVTADLCVTSLEDALLLDVDVRARDALVEALDQRIIADDITLAAPDEPVALIGLEGPRAEALLGGVADVGPFGNRMIDVGGVALRVVRAGQLGAEGFVLHAPAAAATAVWDALVAAEARPCGMDALESRRVEVGVPRLGVDMGEKTLAIELPLEAAISSTKGCYLGQEVVARGTQRGKVNRRLMGLRLEGPAPALGAALVRDGKETGYVTSVTYAFGAGTLAALGFVRREHWEAGTELAVRDGHAVTIARVTPWPLA